HDPTNAWQISQIHLDPDTQPRTIVFHWDPSGFSVPNPFGATPVWPVLHSIDFPTTGGQTETVTFDYVGGVFTRSAYTSGGATCTSPNYTTFAAVPLLSTITSTGAGGASETFSFAYKLPTISGNMLPVPQVDDGAL